MAESLILSLSCNRRAVPVIAEPQLAYVLLSLSPDETLAGQRLPLNFTLLLDHSGSMAGEKLRTMKEAVKNIIDQLTPADVLSVVTFESSARVLIAAQAVANAAELKQQVEQIRESGGTNMAAGLREALGQARQNHQEGRVSRIVLLTDGEATDPPADSRLVADEAGRLGIPVIGLGFGRDWNEQFLCDLADHSVLAEPGSRRGMADYIPTPADAAKIFQEVYQSMQVVAQEVNLTLRMVQGVEARRVWQVTPLINDLGSGVIQGRSLAIPVGQLERSGVVYLAELMLPPRPPGMVRVAQSDATYSLPNQPPGRVAADLILPFAQDDPATAELDQGVMNIVEKVQAFKLQSQALEEAQQGDVAHATRKLRQAVTILLSQGENELAGQMQQEADQLERSGELSSEGKKTIMLSSRKTVRLSDTQSDTQS